MNTRVRLHDPLITDPGSRVVGGWVYARAGGVCRDARAPARLGTNALTLAALRRVCARPVNRMGKAAGWSRGETSWIGLLGRISNRNGRRPAG